MNDIKSERAERTEKAVYKYKNTVYGIAVTSVRSKHDADDVFQEVFMTYLAKAPDFENEEHEKAWLIRTAINISRRYLALPRWVSFEAIGGDMEDVRLDTEEQQRLYNELRSLPRRYRMPLYLHYFEGMSTALCARTLRITEAALRKRLSRGRELLKKRLESEDNETDVQRDKVTAYP